MSYLQAKIMNLIAIVFNVGLVFAGIAFVWQYTNWFVAAVVAGITVVSSFNTVEFIEVDFDEDD